MPGLTGQVCGHPALGPWGHPCRTPGRQSRPRSSGCSFVLQLRGSTQPALTQRTRLQSRGLPSKAPPAPVLDYALAGPQTERTAKRRRSQLTGVSRPVLLLQAPVLFCLELPLYFAAALPPCPLLSCVLTASCEIFGPTVL